MTLVVDNRLVNSHHDKALLLSMWMHDPEQQRDYHDFAFRISQKPVVIADGLPPVPVMVDPATDRYLQDKVVEYVCETYRHEATMTMRVRIKSVRVAPGPHSDVSIAESWADFLPKFLDFHRKRAEKSGDDESTSDDDDDDDDEVERPERRRKARS